MKPPNEEHTVSESTNHVYPKAAAGEQSANVAPNPSFPKLEESVLDYWDKDDTFQKSIDRRPSGDHSQNEFVFFDGPPFANGLPHYGHLLTGYAKDVIPRYQTMKGHKVNRVFGWDTHGLPAELEAQKELGIDSVDQVKEMGIDKFNDACRASVLKYTNEWKAYVHRQARWVDFEHGYKTLNISYMESVMWAFKQLYDKGLAYQGYRVLPYCPKDQTPLSAHELRMDADVYQDRQDTTVSVAVKLRDEEDAYAVFWTTTPWTVPTNFAIVVGADIDYVEVRPTEGKFAGKKFYLGKPLLGSYEKELGENYEIVRELKGSEMEGWRYYPVFPYFAGDENAAEGKVPGPEGYQIFTADYVDTVEGTGLVHQAPYGEDDMNTLNAKGIKSVDVLDAGCKFTVAVPGLRGPVRVRRQQADPAQPARRRRPAGPRPGRASRHPLPGEELRALLPALLALRHPADLQAGELLVRGRHQDQGPPARTQPADQLDSGQCEGRPVRQVAGERTRLVDLPQPLLGFPDSGVGLRRPEVPARGRVRLAGRAQGRLRRLPARSWRATSTCTARTSTS